MRSQHQQGVVAAHLVRAQLAGIVGQKFPGHAWRVIERLQADVAEAEGTVRLEEVARDADSELLAHSPARVRGRALFKSGAATPMMVVMNIGSVGGIQNLTRVFERAAGDVNAAACDASASGPDLADGMVGMSLAASGIKANIAVLRTTDEMLGSLLDVRA